MTGVQCGFKGKESVFRVSAVVRGGEVGDMLFCASNSYWLLCKQKLKIALDISA